MASNTPDVWASGIACFTSGCHEPVVGQCAGYNGGCGRFYCSMHSEGRLCVECAGLKLQHETFTEYVVTAEKIASRAGWYYYTSPVNWLIVLLYLASIALIFIPYVGITNPCIGVSSCVSAWPAGCTKLEDCINIWPVRSLVIDRGIALVGAVTFGILMQVRVRTMEKSKVTAAGKTRPGFKEFYKVYKRERNKELIRQGFAIASKTLQDTIAKAVQRL